jgi:predicted nucleic acid-binding protein
VSFYDSIYLALAAAVRDGRMVTADEKLCNAIQDSPLAPLVIFLGNMPAS